MPNSEASLQQSVGPILFFHRMEDDCVRLAALVIRYDDGEAPVLEAHGRSVQPERLERIGEAEVVRYGFSIPATGDATYTLDGVTYAVNADLRGDLRFAFVSCNGKEAGDSDRHPAERNRLWNRLAAEHDRESLNLLLHGGDQLYADEMLHVHPVVRDWAAGGAGRDVTDADVKAARDAMRGFLFERYVEVFTQPDTAHLMARVPSLCMWDDHDICDGWGSLPPDRLDSPVGRAVFETARELFTILQLGAPSDRPPPICLDEDGRSFGWAVQLPGVAIVAPDLRSERRPDRVMGEPGWTVFRRALERAVGNHVLVMSSVPALGPRLSWVEGVMRLIPRMQKYEDDLRDQWQSRAHRSEWRAFLRALLDLREKRGRQVTLVSGEIHLATHATMIAGDGLIHQLVASGIAHPPPPKAYARALGALARLGETPVSGHPIRLHPLPGQKGVYTAQRNYLILERIDGAWQAHWELELDGATPALNLER